MTGFLIAFAVLMQTLELLYANVKFSEVGVWRWSLIREDFAHWPRPLRAVCDFLFNERGFLILLLAQLVCATGMIIWAHPVWVVALWVTVFLVALRWRGTFNGGSDAMTMVVLTGMVISVVAIHFNKPAEIGLWYIAVHVCISYVRSGLVKITRQDWRNGESLRRLLTSSYYNSPPELRVLARSPWAMKILSWAILVFECSFPLVLIGPQVATFYILAGVMFHLANVYILGLNRFFWAWIATYPALMYCSLST